MGLTHVAAWLGFASSSSDASAEFTATSSTERKLTLEARLLSQQDQATHCKHMLEMLEMKKVLTNYIIID